MLLLQYSEGSPLTFVEDILELESARECVNELLAYVKPSQASITRILLSLKQNPREPITAFIIRFNNATIGVTVPKPKW